MAGGAVHCLNARCHLSRVTITNGQAGVCTQPAAIAPPLCAHTLRVPSHRCGWQTFGGAYDGSSADQLLTDVTIVGCSSLQWGGGISIHESRGQGIRLSQLAMHGTHATKGGAMSLIDADIACAGCMFSNSFSSSDGGAVYVAR